jgi:hypothetical protein
MKLTVDQAKKVILDELTTALDRAYDALDDHFMCGAYGDRDDYEYNSTLLTSMLRATSCSPFTFDETFLLQVLEEVQCETGRDPLNPN